MRRALACAVLLACEASSPAPPSTEEVIDMVELAGGRHLTRCQGHRCSQAYEYETPVVVLGAFAIDRRPVTRAAFAACVAAGACADDELRFPGRQPGPACPSRVSAAAAEAYCRWSGRRLPTSDEAERAYRGSDGRLHPWGDDEPTCETHRLLGPGVACGESECLGMDRTLPAITRGPDGVEMMAATGGEWTSDELELGDLALLRGGLPSGGLPIERHAFRCAR